MSHRLRLPAALITALLGLLALTGPAGAVETRRGNLVTVPPGHIEGPLFVAGRSLVINADVDGDVFAAGGTVTVNGVVDGDLLAAGRTVLVNGSVTGNVRCLAQQMTVRAGVGRSLTALAQSLEILPGSTVTRDVVAFARTGLLSGAVGRQVLGAGGSVTVNGPVGGDVRLWSVTRLTLGPAAAVAGNVAYTSADPARVEPGAKIAGRIDRHPPPVRKTVSHHRLGWWSALLGFVAGSVAWGVLALLFPGLGDTLAQALRRSPWPPLGWGLIALVAVPPLALLLLITVIGIPLSLALIAAYVFLLYAAKLIAGDFLGRLLAARLGRETLPYRIGFFLAGFAALVLLTRIPVAGFLINLVVDCLALGAVLLAIHRRPGLPV